MNRVSAIITAALAASTAHATPSGTWSWDWVHVEPGTTNQITPKVPGVVSPGEAVEFRGTFELAGMGTQVTTHQGFSGPIVGFAGSSFHFQAGTNHGGLFYAPVDREPLPPGGEPVIEPGRVALIYVGQVSIEGEPLAYPGSTFPNAVRIRWDPVTYEERLVNFQPDPVITGPGRTGTSAIILRDPAALSYAVYRLPMSSWGSVQVPIIPSPSGLALLGLAGMLAIRRQERRVNSLRTCSCRWGRGTLAE